MIRVNLLQGRVSKGPSITGTSAVSDGATRLGTMAGIESGGKDGKGAKGIAINVVALLVAPLGLMIYEYQVISKLKQESVTLTASNSKLEKSLADKKALVAKSADLTEKAKELATKTEILKKLARLRLREVRALDFVQNVIPEKVWLKSVTFKAGALNIKGLAITDDEMTAFVRSIEKSRYFSNVLLLQAREEKTKDGSVKVFELVCNVEVE